MADQGQSGVKMGGDWGVEKGPDKSKKRESIEKIDEIKTERLEEVVGEKKEQISETEAMEKFQQKTQGIGSDDDSDSKDDEEESRKVKTHAEDVSKIQDAEDQINKLVELATHEKPETAIKVAKRLDSNYVMDKVHDELVEDQVYKILVEKGLLKVDNI